MSFPQLSIYNPLDIDPAIRGGRTLRGLFGDFELARLDGVADATRRKYLDTLALWDQAGLGGLDVSQIDNTAAMTFKRFLQSRPGRFSETAADYTIRHHLARLARICKWLLRERYLDRVPDGLTHRVDPERTLARRWIREDELARLLAACDTKRVPRGLRVDDRRIRPGQWWRALVLVISGTGIRISEALALRWADYERDLMGQVVLTIRPLVKRARARRWRALDEQAAAAVAVLRPPPAAALSRGPQTVTVLSAQPLHQQGPPFVPDMVAPPCPIAPPGCGAPRRRSMAAA